MSATAHTVPVMAHTAPFVRDESALDQGFRVHGSGVSNQEPGTRNQELDTPATPAGPAAPPYLPVGATYHLTPARNFAPRRACPAGAPDLPGAASAASHALLSSFFPLCPLRLPRSVRFALLQGLCESPLP